MKISTEIESVVTRLGDAKGLQLLAKAGFDGWDFTMNAMGEGLHPLAGSGYIAYVRSLRQTGEDLGMVCNQSHAPFPSDRPELLKRAIECTAEAGGTICVIHPLQGVSMEETTEFYHSLLPFAKACGVKIAAENILSPDACATPEQYLLQLADVSDPALVACLDIGHAEIAGSAVEMIHALGRHLQTLHIHDNDKRRDLHQLPFTGAIDFAPIMKALKDTGYDGWLTLEADGYLNSLPDTSVEASVPHLFAAARQLRKLYDEA